MSRQEPSHLKGRDALLCAELRRMVAALPAGSILPSTAELKKRFSVGQGVLKRVLGVLADEGWVMVRDGKGTFVMDRRHLARPAAAERGAGFHVPWISASIGELVLAVCGDQAETQILRDVVEQYNAQSPDVRVTVRSLRGFRQLLEPRMQDSIDLFAVTSIIEKHDLPDPGFCLDLAPYLTASPPPLPVYDCAWERDPRSGRVEGVAVFLVTTQLGYRRDTFRSLRLSWSAAPTWAEVLEKGCRLRAQCEPAAAFAFLGYMPFFYRWGIRLTDRANPRRIKIAAAELGPLLGYLHELIVAERVAPFWLSVRPQLYGQIDYPQGYAMAECASFAAPAHRQADLGFIPLPRAPGGVDLIHYPILCARATTPHPEECWGFIRYFLSEPGQHVVARCGIGLPPAREIPPAAVSDERLQAMQTAVQTGTVVYRDSAAPYQARYIIEKQLEKHLRQGGDAVALARDIEAKANTLLGRRSAATLV